MNKIVFRGLILVLSIFAVYQGLKEIPWTKWFGIDNKYVKIDKEVGDRLWELIEKTEKISSDTNALRIVDSIVNQLVVRNNLKQTRIIPHVIENIKVNAFALPGGHLVVHSALIEKVNSQEQLAGVLAHEISHITEGHISKKLMKEFGIAILTGATGGGEGARQILSFLSSRAYDRNLESDADMHAVDLMHNAQIDPLGLSEFMEIMAESDLPTELDWISTHPSSEERAIEIKKRVSELPEIVYVDLKI